MESRKKQIESADGFVAFRWEGKRSCRPPFPSFIYEDWTKKKWNFYPRNLIGIGKLDGRSPRWNISHFQKLKWNIFKAGSEFTISRYVLWTLFYLNLNWQARFHCKHGGGDVTKLTKSGVKNLSSYVTFPIFKNSNKIFLKF